MVWGEVVAVAVSGRMMAPETGEVKSRLRMNLVTATLRVKSLARKEVPPLRHLG